MADSGATAPVRRRRVLVAVVLSLAVITGFLAMFAVWANRQALNTDNWTSTSGQLLEDKDVQTVVSAYMVDELFRSVDVAGALEQVLPPRAAPLAGPAAAGLRQLADRAAPRLLASPQVQDAWRSANRAAHATALRILNDEGNAVSTANGDVVLNLRPLVDQLAATLGVEKQVAAARTQLQGSTGAKVRGAAQQKLNITLPQTSGHVVIMHSDDLQTAQSAVTTIKSLAIVLTVLSLLLFALAVWLAVGWRRVAFRTVGWCFVGLGITVLLLRRLGGDAIVDGLVNSPSVKPAAHSAWTIGTTLLYDIAIAMFAYGVAFVAAAWLAGSTRPAVAVRRWLAPSLRYHLAPVYGAVALAYLLLLAWGPTPALHKPLGMVLFALLIVLGVELLRRLVAREHPDVPRGGVPRAAGRSKRFGRPAPASTVRVDDLERLSVLHDRGVLSDQEFDSQKVQLLNGS